MKKNILFVNPSLSTGGAEKSLFGMLKYWDYEKYNVDVYTFAERGEYADKLDAQQYLFDFFIFIVIFYGVCHQIRL